MPVAAIPMAAEAAMVASAEAAAIAAAEAAAVQAAQVAAAEAAAAAAAEQAAATAATNTLSANAANLATNQSILGAIGAGGGAPASAALGGAGSGLGATSAYTGATSALTGTPAYGMPAGLEQIANPAVTAAPPAYGMPAGTEGLLPGNAPGFNPMSQAELAQIQSNIPQAGPRVDLAGTMDAVNPEMLNQVAPEAAKPIGEFTPNYTSTGTGPGLQQGLGNTGIKNPGLTPADLAGPSEYSMTQGLNYSSPISASTLPTAPPPSTLENAFTKAMDWVKDNKLTTLSMGMNAAKMFGKSKGDGSDNNKYSGVLSKYKLSDDFQGRFANPEDYQYKPKAMAQGGIAQIGGPVEQMSNANAVGANTGYPMADISKGAYATPYQTPISRNVISGVSDTGVNPMTGEMRFAEGGITGQGNLDLNIPLNIGGGGGGGGSSYGDGGGAGYSGGYSPSNGGFGSGMLAPAVQPRGQFAGGNNQGLGGLTGLANGIMGLFGNLNGRAQTPSYEQYLAGRSPMQQDVQMTREQYDSPRSMTAAPYAQVLFKEGGSVASYSDGGKAAMDYYERMTKPKEGFSGKSDPGSRYAGDVVFDTDPDTRSLDPVTAAMVRQAKVNKRANMQLPATKRPTPMGQINMVPVTMKKSADESSNTVDAAQGGIMSLGGYAAGGNPRLLKGPGDGMSDNIPATISGKQPARLADGEFVVPADVVSHLGNGSTEAGAKKLHQMMTNVRKARTGNPKQGKQINPNKYMPK